MRFRAPVMQAALLFLVSATIYGCSGGGGAGANTSDQPSPTTTFQPQARFSASPVSGNAALAVQFTNESTLGAEVFANYTWVFGDGGVSNEKSPLHTYQFAGVYTVTLFVKTAVGTSTETKTNLVTVSVAGPPPVPDFSATPRSGVAPLTVQFTDQSDLGGNAFATYSWDFGDGQTSSERHPLHKYPNVGLYTVSLTVATAGGTGIETKPDFIEALIFVPPPDADFSATPTSGAPPLDVQFTNLSNLNDAESGTYLWDFGDGQTSTEQHPFHTYDTLGLFAVSLTTTTRGGVDTETKADFIDVNLLPPIADFFATPTAGQPPLHVQFTDLSDLDGATDVTYLWDFDDGATSAEQNPDHDYSAVGLYTVSLTVTTLAGTDTKIRNILVAINESKNFVFAFQQNNSFALPILSVFISAQVATSGQVSIPGLGFLQAFSVMPGTATEISIPIEAMIVGSDITAATGIEIFTNDPINVYGLNRFQYTTDGFAAFPVELLGMEHFMMSARTFNSVDHHFSSQFAIIADEDNTTIQITPTVSTGIRNAGVTYTVELDRLEVYQLQTDGPLGVIEDLTGTQIVSDKPVAVFSGNECAAIGGACDHLVEQLPPVAAWGSDLITVPLAPVSGGNIFRVLAAHDGTTVSIQGPSPETIPINAGQFVERFLQGIHRIRADRPILVAQFARGDPLEEIEGHAVDPFMMIMMPAERFLSAYTFATPSSIPESQDFDINYINIVAPATDAASGFVLLDGIPVDPGLFVAVPGTLFAAAQVPVAPGSHTITAPNPFGLYIYGFAHAESYGYPGGMAF